jgi:ParB-like chromosome segregation protein Spo0J
MRTHDYKGTTYQLSDAHPAADCLPWSTDNEEFTSLVDSMRQHGFYQDRPIMVLLDGRIIGGRRRELAAKIAGVQPIYSEIDIPENEIVNWVVAEDLIRRNLTPSQRAMAMVELAKLNQKGANQFSRENKAKEEGLYSPSSPMTIDEIAEQAQVGRNTAKEAAKVKKQAPELMDAVKEGDLSASTAAKVSDLPKPARKRVAEAANPKAQAKKELDRAKASPPDEAPEDDAEEVDEEKAAAEEWAKELNILCRDMDAIVKRIRDIKDSKFQFMCHWESSAQQVESARSSIFSGRPVNRCPYCEKDGRTDPKCTCCKGTGYCAKGSRKAGAAAVGGGK